MQQHVFLLLSHLLWCLALGLLHPPALLLLLLGGCFIWLRLLLPLVHHLLRMMGGWAMNQVHADNP
jgi:hypothetical protein